MLGLQKTILQGLKQQNLHMARLILQKNNCSRSKTTKSLYGNVSFIC